MNSTTVRKVNQKIVKIQGNKVLTSYNRTTYKPSSDILKERNVTKIREKINGGYITKTRENVRYKEKSNSNINFKVLIKYFLMFSIVISLSLYKVMIGYSVSQLQYQKSVLSKELNDKKLTLQSMEEKYMSLFDIKKVQDRSIERGFIYNDKIEYLKKFER